MATLCCTNCETCFSLDPNFLHNRSPIELPCKHIVCKLCTEVEGGILVCARCKSTIDMTNNAQKSAVKKLENITLNKLKKIEDGNKEAEIISITCSIHMEELRFYCNNCEKLLCPGCVGEPNHRCHDIQNLTDLISKMKKLQLAFKEYDVEYDKPEFNIQSNNKKKAPLVHIFGKKSNDVMNKEWKKFPFVTKVNNIRLVKTKQILEFGLRFCSGGLVVNGEDIIVFEWRTDKVDVFSLEGQLRQSFNLPSGTQAEGMVCCNNYFYVWDYKPTEKKRLLHILQNDRTLVQSVNMGYGSSLAVHNDSLFVACWATNTVYELNLKSSKVDFDKKVFATKADNINLDGPHFIACDGSTVAVSCPTHRVFVFDRGGTLRFTYGTGKDSSGDELNYPHGGLAIDSFGNILIADEGNDRVAILRSYGKVISYIKFEKPWHLMFNKDILYIATRYIRVVHGLRYCVEVD